MIKFDDSLKVKNIDPLCNFRLISNMWTKIKAAYKYLSGYKKKSSYSEVATKSIILE